MSGDIQRSALFGPDRIHRYGLYRTWDTSRPAVHIILLNPSTADEMQDDQTMRRCMSLAAREGYGGMTVSNLFAYRSTDPATLRATPDPIGPDNNHWITRHAETHGATWVAWGVHGAYRDRGAAVLELLAGRTLWCLGRTKDGHPKHPLYLAADTPLEEYR